MNGEPDWPSYDIVHCEELSESYSFFWGGPYSQWANIGFVYGDFEFNRAEQFMMFCKAILFRDGAKAREILATANARKQKALGREVSGFDQDIWNDIASDIVYSGSYCKYTQNPEVRDYLMNDPADIIVEASPHDPIWGIALAADDPRAHDRRQWQGLNLLGKAITEVRQFLRDPGLNDPRHYECADRIAGLFGTINQLPEFSGKPAGQ